VGLFPIEEKSVSGLHGTGSHSDGDDSEDRSQTQEVSDGPLILDVRTPMEFEMGAYPGAVNVNLDELMEHTDEFGAKDREIVVYCASGARSSYATRLLEQAGFTNVRNAGGLHQMMANGV
jgi:rhodanese-related sulfurtransferase